jgi:hypothetical protein
MHRFSTMLFSTVLVGALALAYPPKATASTRLPQEDWSWLNDTYWYVTPDDLPAVATDLTTQQHEPVLDQTVWFIEGYAHGYFWGKTFVQLMGRPRLCLHLVGSVTPEGAVLITFTLVLPQLPPELTQKTTGIGRMRLVHGEWRVEMQMTTGITTLVTHWAYMKQCQEGEECNQRLPGTQSSLQEFVAPCEQP